MSFGCVYLNLETFCSVVNISRTLIIEIQGSHNIRASNNVYFLCRCLLELAVS